MATTCITNIQLLVNTRETNQLLRGNALKHLPCIQQAYLIIENDIIIDYGSMDTLPKQGKIYDTIIDATGQTVLPTWVDSHTHIVFAQTREQEFIDKLNGLSYAAIAAKGGGILNSADKIVTTSEAALFQTAFNRLQALIRLGTGAIEIKSGYGLSTANELKMLRVIKRIKEVSPIPVKATFLGAHTYPLAFKDNHQGYIDEIIQYMLPAIAAEQLADYVDVFCEEGFFSAKETITICKAAKAYGLQVKLHANQLHVSGGVQAGVALAAISVDHLETMDEAAIQSLANSNTIGTLLPTAAFFLRMPYQPARALIDANCAISLASDYNPGSSPSGNMNFVVALSCIQMKMLPEEAINAATINAAHAMQVEHLVGSISKGKKANLIFTKPIPSIAYLPYAFGDNHIQQVMINGEWFQ